MVPIIMIFAFLFYSTASIWGLCRYMRSSKWQWSLLIGLCVGTAVLNKWLIAFIIFGGWGLYILSDKQNRSIVFPYLHLLLALFVSIVVFLPWQMYISHQFPIESAWEYAFNREHLFKALEGHSGNVLYHIAQLPKLYGWGILLIPFGIYNLLLNSNRKKSIPFFGMLFIIYFVFLTSSYQNDCLYTSYGKLNIHTNCLGVLLFF